ncbi:MAG: GAF domain-containing protein [Bacteroidota bacterium]
MKILPSVIDKNLELPLRLKISFEAIFEYLEEISQNKDHYLYKTANEILKEFKQFPVLREGFEDFNYLYKYNKEIDKLLDLIFPEILQNDEIKAISIPFDFTTFKLSNRFQRILDDAGETYVLKLRNFDESKLFISACIFILVHYYKVKIEFERPFYFDIPSVKIGFTKNYRVKFNKDLFKIKPLKNTAKITKRDIKELLDNYDNIDIWKEKFPIHSYEFKGIGIMNLFDVTSDQLISDVKENLLIKDEQAFLELEQTISNLFGSNSLKFEFSTYYLHNNELAYRYYYNQNSFIVQGKNDFDCDEISCDEIFKKVFKEKEMLTISNVEEYGKTTNYNNFFKSLKNKGIKSVILVPIILTDELFGIMELVSKNKNELNSINAEKLKDIIPVFKMGALRYMEEYVNKLESIIQEHYTSLHPTVKWKFYNAAEKYLSDIETNSDNSTDIKNIVFKKVIPLYGQCDIKGSSIARNLAIQKDLIKQLNLVYGIIEKGNNPIYNDLLNRINAFKHIISNGLNSSDEEMITNFLIHDIYPTLNHLKTLDKSLNEDIENYMQQIDNKLHIIYDKRGKYENSVDKLNEELARFIDKKQIEAQKMFPHYFERYKTDGVDHTMYIGESLVKKRVYNKIDLNNLRLWQLQLMCELENIVYGLKDKLEHPLEIASLILVHNKPLSIKFRMDEKRFDIDGAQNVRYEIIKKRIDKSYIKNTNERLTVPGKIAIVYSQVGERNEYLKYIKHLQTKNYLLDTVENIEIEDMKGVSGLKALRVSVNYGNKL